MPNLRTSTQLQFFTVWSNELENRLDCYYYQSDFRKKVNLIAACKYPVFDLGDLITDLKNGVEIRTYSGSGFRYLRVTDLGEDGLSNHDPRYVDVDNVPAKIKLSLNDFLVSRSGSLGLVSEVDEEMLDAILSSHIFRLSLDTSKVLPTYLAAYLRSDLGQFQFFQKNNGGVIPEINQSALKSIKIIVPPLNIQKRVVDLTKKSYAEKQKREQEIKAILTSIDGYVLDELGIESIAGGVQQVFQIWSDEVSNRLDPLYLRNLVTLKNLKPKYGMTTLESLLSIPPQYGANESAIEGVPEQDVRYIRITDVDENGDLKSEGWKTAAQIQEKYLLEQNDLLFARSGATAGKSFIYKKEFGKAIFAGYMIRFKVDEKKADPEYIFSFTKTMWYDLWVKTIQRPSGQPNINSEEYKSLQIPLPPLPIQNKIAKEVWKRCAEADALKRNSMERLIMARKEVERMILA